MSTPPSERQAQSERAASDRKKAKEAAIVRSSPGLMPYGTQEELAIMVSRMKFMLPGGDKLKDQEVWALSQAAFAHGLNPLIGECYWINGFAPGIKGIRRKSHEQARTRFGEGEDWRIESYDPITKPVDLDMHKIPPGALAYKARLVVSKELKDHAEVMKTVREALGSDAPYEVVLENAGPRPVTEGIGYVTAEQMFELDNPRWYHNCTQKAKAIEAKAELTDKGKVVLRGQAPCPYCGYESYAKPSSMPHDQRARKRAEAHALKQRFDLPFEIQPGGDGLVEEEWDYGDVIEGDFNLPADTEFDAVAQVAKDANMTPEEAMAYLKMKADEEAHAGEMDAMEPEDRKAKAQAGSAALFGGPDQPPQGAPEQPAPDGPKPLPKERGWSAGVVDQLKADAAVPSGATGFQIVGRLNLSPFNEGDPYVWIREWMMLYVKYRGTSKAKDASQKAASQATEEWKKIHFDDAEARSGLGDAFFDSNIGE
jgi:hypothetical protein